MIYWAKLQCSQQNQAAFCPWDSLVRQSPLPPSPPRPPPEKSVYLQLFLEIQKHTMNQRLILEKPVQFVLSPGSDSELSDINGNKEDEII